MNKNILIVKINLKELRNNMEFIKALDKLLFLSSNLGYRLNKSLLEIDHE